MNIYSEQFKGRRIERISYLSACSVLPHVLFHLIVPSAYRGGGVDLVFTEEVIEANRG